CPTAAIDRRYWAGRQSALARGAKLEKADAEGDEDPGEAEQDGAAPPRMHVRGAGGADPRGATQVVEQHVEGIGAAPALRDAAVQRAHRGRMHPEETGANPREA